MLPHVPCPQTLTGQMLTSHDHCASSTRSHSCTSCCAGQVVDDYGCSYSNCYINQNSTRRPYGLRHSLLVASFMVLSFSSVSVPVGAFLPHQRIWQHQHQASPTARFVVTDPDHLLWMEVAERRRSSLEALEDIYMQSPDVETLRPTELIEKIQTPTKSSKSRTATTNKNSVKKEPTKARRVLKSRTALPKRSRAVPAAAVSTSASTSVNMEPEMGLVPLPVSPKGTMGRSSTMPGFGSRSISDRRQAHMDGIAIVEEPTGRTLSKEQRKRIGDDVYKAAPSVPDSLVQFANEIHTVDRITPKEEKVLGIKTQEAIRLQRLYDNLAQRLQREPSDEEWCAAAGKINVESLSQAIEDGLEAKNKLVTSNLRMVQGVVNVYLRNGLGSQYNAGDLMQDGIMALIRAAEKFDPSRGFRFSTYALYWIRASIKRSQLFQSRIIRVPPRLHETHKRLLRVQQDLTDSLEQPPTVKKLAEVTGMSEYQIERCTAAMKQRCVSLDQAAVNRLRPPNADEESSMYDLIAAQTSDDDKWMSRKFLREDLMETMQRVLSPEEVNMLMLRYGMVSGESSVEKLRGERNMTIAEIGIRFGLKPDKVRRLLNNSLKKLKDNIGDEWRHFEQDLP